MYSQEMPSEVDRYCETLERLSLNIGPIEPTLSRCLARIQLNQMPSDIPIAGA
jgi:hypothetical protein